jgi:hypothetical protein
MHDAYPLFLWPKLVWCYLDVIFFESKKYHGPVIELKGFLDGHGDD